MLLFFSEFIAFVWFLNVWAQRKGIICGKKVAAVSALVLKIIVLITL